MKVLLTGASGNFGQQLIKIADFEISQLNRGDWDMLDQKLSRSVDVVVHAASDLRSRASVHPTRLMDSNLMSTLKLLESMRDKQVPRLVFLSSCAVYGNSVHTREGSECRPFSINGICKYLNEEMIREFCTEHGIKFEIYRIFNMYGGNDHFSVVNHLQQAARNHARFILNNQGLAQRDFIHVSCVAAIISQLLKKKDVPFTHVNIGTGIATRISTLLEQSLKQYPQMVIETTEVEEIEYSRADITRLKTMLNMNCISVEQYVCNDFSIPLPGQ